MSVGAAPAIARVAVFTALFLHAGCGSPDPRTVEGAIAFAGEAVEANDARRLFRVIDVRSRHALSSIAADRMRARALILADYPEEARASALSELGDDAQADDAVSLFAARCDEACIAAFRRSLAAPSSTRREGDELVVETGRGSTFRLYRRNDSDWWGFVYETSALARERDQANRDLGVVQTNAETYRARRELAGARGGSAPTAPPPGDTAPHVDTPAAAPRRPPGPTP